MALVISIKFRNRGKPYYFSPNGHVLSEGDSVIVETAQGQKIACCSSSIHIVPDENIKSPLKPVLRKCTAQDLRIDQINRQSEKNAIEICKEKVIKHGLDMKVIECEYNFDGSKITFFFTADGRVDFRELVKDLASVFKVRIELRQVGVRDEAKLLGGIGMCGRPFCCNLYLEEFTPVSTKMAKSQSISLNPGKISGVCGRLMCCLTYEEEAYAELNALLPKIGAYVETQFGFGTVIQCATLAQTVKVKLDNDDENSQRTLPVKEILVVEGGKPEDGSEPPRRLKKPSLPETERRVFLSTKELEDSLGVKSAEVRQAENDAQTGAQSKAQRRPRSSRRMKLASKNEKKSTDNQRTSDVASSNTAEPKRKGKRPFKKRRPRRNKPKKDS